MISDELGLDLKETTLDQLGRAKSVKVQKENTIIVDGEGDQRSNRCKNRSDQVHSWRRPPLSLIKRNYRRDLQNWQAALLLSA